MYDETAMLARPPNLPDYERPPVDEVILGLLHFPIPGFEAVVTRYWEVIRNDYPTVQHQPRIETPVEQLTPFAVTLAPIAVSLNPFGRTWLVSRDDSFVIQTQNDRFLFNWRHRGTPYPRFEPIYELFCSHYDGYREALSSAGLSPMHPLQVEVSYINWIADQSMADFLQPAAATGISVSGESEFPEQQQWNASYLLRRGGQPVARLTVSCNPALRIAPSTEQGIQFALAFKVPLSPTASDDDIRGFFALGREVIVNAFTNLTTDTSQRRWGRMQ